MKLSVAVPTYSVPGGDQLFKRLLDSLWIQTFQDFEVVVTDNSDDDVIKNICIEYGGAQNSPLGICYYRNPIKGMAQNTNEAIRKSKGELIKILYMDDYLYVSKSLEFIVEHFDGYWLVTSCRHTTTGDDTFNTHDPYYSDDIHKGKNTIGSPSVLTIKNEDPLFFDENMTWLLDCDYYKRMNEKYGKPTILKHINVIIGLHENQATHTMGEERKLQEHKYIDKKYDTTFKANI